MRATVCSVGSLILYSTSIDRDGSALAHDHIVKSCDIAASGTHIVTGGYEKKLRVFNVAKPEEPESFAVEGSALAHETNIKSVVLNEEDQQVISADEKCLR